MTIEPAVETMPLRASVRRVSACVGAVAHDAKMYEQAERLRHNRCLASECARLPLFQPSSCTAGEEERFWRWNEYTPRVSVVIRSALEHRREQDVGRFSCVTATLDDQALFDRSFQTSVCRSICRVVESVCTRTRVNSLPFR